MRHRALLELVRTMPIFLLRHEAGSPLLPSASASKAWTKLSAGLEARQLRAQTRNVVATMTHLEDAAFLANVMRVVEQSSADLRAIEAKTESLCSAIDESAALAKRWGSILPSATTVGPSAGASAAELHQAGGRVAHGVRGIRS